jgi:hypothetical protein
LQSDNGALGNAINAAFDGPAPTLNLSGLQDDTKAKLAEIAKQTDEALRKLQLDPSAAATPSPYG